MSLQLSHFKEQLLAFGEPGVLWVAFSGGLDSSVLLHALVQLREELPRLDLRAVHVNHALHPDADRWEAWCEGRCNALRVPFTRLRVRVEEGKGPEGGARQARYAAFEALLGKGEWLATAHHRDDQMETVLLRLMRGTGVEGLAGIPPCRPLGRGLVVRPLLPFERQALRAWAEEEGLTWLEDPANLDTSADRNLLRHRVIPLLRERWPTAARQVARAADHCRDAAEVLAEEEARLLASLEDGEGTLSISALLAQPAPRRARILRAWLHGRGCRMPPARWLERLDREVLRARPDAELRLPLDGRWVHRYRDRLWLVQSPTASLARLRLPWDPSGPLEIQQAGLRLELRPSRGAGIDQRLIETGPLQVRFRQGGERLESVDGHHRPLKKLLQERGVPPWERGRIPLLECRGELVAAGRLWISPHWRARPGEEGLEIVTSSIQVSP